jgi:hypothetical protein
MTGIPNSGRRPSLAQVPSWEYKVAIVAAKAAQVPPDVQQQFRDGLGRRGWIFVSENQGIFHFKRLKRSGARV